MTRFPALVWLTLLLPAVGRAQPTPAPVPPLIGHVSTRWNAPDHNRCVPDISEARQLALNAAVPAELDRIISKLLEKDRSMRYQTAADLGADVKRLRRDSSSRHVAVAAGPTSSPDVATVVLAPGSSPSGAVLDTSVYATVAAAQAAAPTFVQAPAGAAPSGTAATPGAASASAMGLSGVSRTPCLVGSGLGVIVVAAIAGGIGAYVVSRNSAAPAAEVTGALQRPPMC